MELRQYFAVIRRWWWLAVLSVAIAATSSYFVSRSATPLYRAKATLMIGRVIYDPNPSNVDIYTVQQLADTYAQMVRREPVMQGAVESLGWNVSWQALAGRVSASAVPRTQFLEVSVVHDNPYRAKALADAVAEQLVLLSPSNPSVDEEERAFAKQEMDDLKRKIEETRAEIERLQQELDTAISARQIQDLQNQISLLQSKIFGWQSTYAQLLTSLQGGEVNVLSVVEYAPLPGGPIGPNTKMNVLLASTIGLVLAVGGAFLIEYIDDTVKTPDDVMRVTGLPTLGAIARIQGQSYPEKLVAARHPLSPITEAYRVLRTNIQFSSVDRPLRTIMVTSPGPTEGKSITLANLAVVMAQSGLRVILVDTDLRRPVLHKVFDLSNNHGLCDAILQPTVLWTDLLQPTTIDNLRLLTSGALPPNPAELLGSQRMRTMVEDLKQQADVVLFDSPPSLVVADAAILAAHLEGVLVVNDAGHTRRNMAKQGVEELQRVRANMLGVVLNQMSSRESSYYYYYYYYRSADNGRELTRRRRRHRTWLERRLPFLERPSDGHGPPRGQNQRTPHREEPSTTNARDQNRRH
jgi:succinoglycan biosynthesis transport protein ExoP